MTLLIFNIIIGVLNACFFVVYRYLMKRRHALAMIERHQKGFKLGWEAGQEWVFEMDVRDYARARIKYENKKEL